MPNPCRIISFGKAGLFEAVSLAPKVFYKLKHCRDNVAHRDKEKQKYAFLSLDSILQIR